MVALGQGPVQTFHHILHADDGTHLDEASEQEHVEHLAVLHPCRLGHGLYTIYVYVLAHGRGEDAGRVVDECAARFYEGHEAVQRGLIQHYGRVVGVQYGRSDALVREYYGNVGCASALLGSIGRHPCNFLAFDDTCVCQYFSHGEDALSAEARYDYFLFHCFQSLMFFRSPKG